MLDDKLVTVCDSCLCACCWQGEFYCEEFKTAGTVEKTIRELKKLNIEDSGYWEDIEYVHKSNNR